MHLDVLALRHQDVHMRTTLTLDPDVALLVEDAMHTQRRSMKAVINDALRRSLSGEPTAVPYVVEPHHTALMPGIDPAGFNRLLDEMDDDAWIEGRRHADS